MAEIDSPSLAYACPEEFKSETAVQNKVLTQNGSGGVRQRQSRITAWFATSSMTKPALLPVGRKTIVSLFDSTGSGLKCWANLGYDCYAYAHSDKQSEHSSVVRGSVRHIVTRLDSTDALLLVARKHASEVAFAFASPPSRDLSVAGARHWKQKRQKDPEFQDRAVRLVRVIQNIFDEWAVPYYICNPASSHLRKLWRPPNYTYQPYEYGGYLQPTDPHPLYPEFIPIQDAFSQKQGLWTGGGFKMPPPKPVTPTWKYFTSSRKTGAGGTRTRRMSPVLFSSWKSRGARASTPRGFSLALCMRMRGVAS